MINLTEKDKEQIEYDEWDKVVRFDLSTGSHYAKFTDQTGAFRELFGKKIFDKIGISSPEYLFLKEKNCILSTDLKETYKNLIFGYELEDITNMGVLYDTLKQFTNCDELITQVNIMHFIDILFCNTDRHSSNYAFSVNEDGTAKLVVLDNELMLHDFYHATRPVSFPTQCHLTFTQYTKECEYKYFLETLPEDQKEILYRYLQMFDPKTVYSITTSIEEENNCKFKDKKKLFLNYVKNYMTIYKRTILDRRQSKKNQKVKTKQENQ